MKFIKEIVLFETLDKKKRDFNLRRK